MSKQTVAVVFGSRSAEHDISIITALSGLIKPLALSSKYRAVPVYISKDGGWYSETELGTIDFYTQGDLNEKLSRLKQLQLQFEDGLTLLKPGVRAAKTKVDFVFPATHGTYGEDGSLMGLLRMADVPFAGLDMSASAVAMDKVLSKQVTSAVGLLNPKYQTFSKDAFTADQTDMLKQLAKLAFPLFVKPTHLGSSIAVTRVSNQKELEQAIEVALHYDNAVIVEEAVKNLVEVTVPILGTGDYKLGLVEEALNKDAAFFDFETKYMHGGKKGKGKGGGQGHGSMPAKLPKALYRQCEQVAREAFRAIGGDYGYSRIDLLVDTKAKKVYFNEINPMPGSLQQHNWKQAGTSPLELVHELIELGQQRWQQQQKLTTKFDTSFLQQF